MKRHILTLNGPSVSFIAANNDGLDQLPIILVVPLGTLIVVPLTSVDVQALR